MITATITFYNIECLKDLENTNDTMSFLATIYIEDKPVRSFHFNKLESAHRFVSMYVGKD